METDAPPEAEKTWRDYKVWGVCLILYSIVMGGMVGSAVDHPWWFIPAAAWAGLGWLLGGWAQRKGYAPDSRKKK